MELEEAAALRSMGNNQSEERKALGGAAAGGDEGLSERQEGASGLARAQPSRDARPFSAFRGVSRPPAVLPRPARGRLGPGALAAWPARRPLPSSRAVVQEGETCRSPRPPRRSQARQTLTHSCPEGRRRCASTLSPGEAQLPVGSRSDWQAARGEAGNMGSSPVPSSVARVPGAGVPQPGSGRGSSGRRVAFAAQMLSLAPGLGGRSPEHLGPGRRPGPEEAT